MSDTFYYSRECVLYKCGLILRLDIPHQPLLCDYSHDILARKLFEQLLDLLEELGQYLLAPDGLVLQPELVFADANLENFSFCYLPGKQGHTGCFQKQIRELMEYLLPKLDHQEQDAVVLGYGLYREISAEIFSVEMIQALLYQTGKEKKETTEQEGKERPREENPPVQMEETL